MKRHLLLFTACLLTYAQGQAQIIIRSKSSNQPLNEMQNRPPAPPPAIAPPPPPPPPPVEAVADMGLSVPGEERVPFEGIDMTWQNGADRRETDIWAGMKYFKPTIMVDVNYDYSFNEPKDNTVNGSTVTPRHNELQLSALHFGGDFNYGSAHARVITQFGTRPRLVNRGDGSVYRGDGNLEQAYRYLSEAYAGFHINKMHGINIEAGLFTSYIGLNSYYQAENWDYQASFTSDNTPWYFNGLRIQLFVSRTLKIEPWIVNGWQSYGKFNAMPGVGGNITWAPNSDLKLVTNNYYGKDAAGVQGRSRFHSDNSVLVRYLNRPERRGISRMAVSVTGDIGFETGSGVGGFNPNSKNGPMQYYLSGMLYNRIWFCRNKLATTMGGGYVVNPGRYLVLPPLGESSPLPRTANPLSTEGTYPFSMKPGDRFEGWDASANVDYMPNQSITLRLEGVYRHSNVPYFSGRGGVTSPSGYTTEPIPAGWQPDLVRSETRVILALLFRI